MADLSKFEQYYKLADIVIREGNERTARRMCQITCTQRSVYEARHRELPPDETMALVDMSEPTELRKGRESNVVRPLYEGELSS